VRSQALCLDQVSESRDVKADVRPPRIRHTISNPAGGAVKSTMFRNLEEQDVKALAGTST
jgi:hypothetical protein